MFNGNLRDRIERLEHAINGGPQYYSREKNIPRALGMTDHLYNLNENYIELRNENDKLKAIVAELCNYVYSRIPTNE